MAVIEIGGKRVSVPSSFLSLSPEQQQATVDEISQSLNISAQAEPVSKFPGYLTTQGQMAASGQNTMSRGAGQFADAMRFATSGAGRNLTEDTPANRVAGGFDAMEGRQSPLTTGEYEGARSESVQNLTHGTGNMLGGALEYVTSPINSALRTVVGNPLEHLAGIPKEYSEFTAGMFLPVPKRIPGIGGGSKVAPKAAPTVDELKASYTAAKNSPEVAAVKIKPESMGKAADELKVKLDTEWLDAELSPKTHHILTRLTNPPEGATVTMQNVDSARRRLGAMAGRGDEEAAAAQIAKKDLDKWMESIKPADTLAGDPAAAQKIMQEGRADYSRAKTGEALDSRLAQAELQAAGTYSGLNIQNQLRQKTRQFLNSDDSRSINASERAALESFVRGTATQNTLRYVGSLLGGGGGLGAMVSGQASIALPLGGLGLNRLSARLSSKQAAALSDAIRSNSPLGRKLASPMSKFDEASMQFSVSPTPQNLVRATLAARNLSTNLKDAGIAVSPNDLLKSLQGPMTGRAEDEQP